VDDGADEAENVDEPQPGLTMSGEFATDLIMQYDPVPDENLASEPRLPPQVSGEGVSEAMEVGYDEAGNV